MKMILILLVMIATVSCDRTSCARNVACTEEFRSIGVNIRAIDGAPVALDMYTVVDGEDELALDANVDMERGWHVIFTDAFQSQYENREVTLTLTGYIDGTVVVNQDFVVGADCCHVFLVSGPEEIFLN